ncbi:bifunctional diguanylate cyclase/phosphodiesterase [Amphritea sp. HPY]|uniref:bifunctional diguanylate cyclase/phosphodiesterase n=1 Tax=Amphritea sp. HPY TaxID=3421652 RepID=UPI003D7E0D68
MIRPQKKIIIKYLSFLMCIAIIPMLLIGYFSYQTSSNTLQRSEDQFVRTLLNSQSERLDQQLGQVESLIANIAGVEEITRVLDDINSPTNTYTRLATQARIGYILNGYLNLQGLVSIDIFTEGGAHYHVGDSLDIEEINTTVRDRIREAAMISGQQVYWAGVQPNVSKASSYKKVLTAARVFNTIDRETMRQRPTAMLMVNYSLEYLAQQFAQFELMAGSQLVLLDQTGNIIYSNQTTRVGQPAEGIFEHLLQTDIKGDGLTWNQQRFLVRDRPMAKYGWHLISVIPEESLLAGAKNIREVTLLLLLIGFMMVALVAWYFNRNILTPIRAIIDGYKQLQANAFDPERRLTVRSSDEVGELVKGFNSFLDNLAAQKASAAALIESERRYELVVNASREGLWDWNLKTNSLYLSPRFLTLIGLDSSVDFLSDRTESWFDLIHPDDLEIVQQEVDQHICGNSPHFECEYRLRHNDGSYLWVLSHGLAERDSTNQAIRMAGSLSDISDRKEAEHQLRHDAFHDNLTGLSNRFWFVSYLEKKLNHISRHSEEVFAVLFLDLDQFKLTNDILGHAAGDKLLIQVAGRLQDCLRSSDLLARFGGDEFVILLEHSEDFHYINVAERIIEALARPFQINGQEIMSGASIGITLSISGYTDPDEMLRDADIAMYQAKLSDKQRYMLFDENMRKLLLTRTSLEQDLKEALAANQLELHYQPIIALADGSLAGCEALLRWRHKSRGMVSPDEFIAVAETSNLINSLGQWVLETACKQIQLWRQLPGLDDFRLSINLSARQFHDEQFLQGLPQTLADFDIDCTDLAFEITETAIIRDNKLAARVIGEFKKMGIKVHLDDFGTGFSSLSHLSDFPIDQIKIDRSFVMQCIEHKKHDRVVRGILNMAQELGIHCTAEGIETPEQLQLLQENGCEYGQGYLFARPMPAPEMERVIKNYQPACVEEV